MQRSSRVYRVRDGLLRSARGGGGVVAGLAFCVCTLGMGVIVAGMVVTVALRAVWRMGGERTLCRGALLSAPVRTRGLPVVRPGPRPGAESPFAGLRGAPGRRQGSRIAAAARRARKEHPGLPLR